MHDNDNNQEYNKELRLEKAHLNKIYKKICQDLEKRQNEVDSYHGSVVSANRDMWENEAHTWDKGDTDAAVQIKQSLDLIKQEKQKHDTALTQLKKLARLKRSAYFGRVDYMEDGYMDIEQIYMGVSTLFDENGDILIYDWRAPISSIFYDYELGDVSYLSKEGEIHGKVNLKRQYNVEEDELLYMFDTGIRINDEFLQEILSKNVDEKMRSIVNSIQREQNRVIRDEDHKLLMVQGVAGSGKTSIALHRIAYMLYRYRDQQMTSKNILIFSPNAVFNDYISNVLPELGEENMQQTTFFEFLEGIMNKENNQEGNQASPVNNQKSQGKQTEGFKLEDGSSQMEFILSADRDGVDKSRLLGIQYKSSMAFYRLLNNYAKYLLNRSFHFRDVVFKAEVLISKDSINDMFYKDYNYLPLTGRLDKIKRRLLYLIKPAWKNRLEELVEELSYHHKYGENPKAYGRLFVYREFKEVRDAIDEMLSFNSYRAFVDLFKDTLLFEELSKDDLPEDYLEICKDTAERLERQYLTYEDLCSYVYFKSIVDGASSNNIIRHVVIDEAQDYTPVQYAIIKQYFSNTNMTLLGDFNQAINPLFPNFNYEKVEKVLKPSSSLVLELTKDYRSTSDIVSFTRQILGDNRVESIERPGEKPWVISCSDENDMAASILLEVKDLKEQGFKSIGIICKTASDSRKIYDKVRKQISTILVTKDDQYFSDGIIILPVYLAKGLEFDVTLVYQANNENYGLEGDRRLFYTACTRALHKLKLYYTGKPSSFIKEISSNLYIEK